MILFTLKKMESLLTRESLSLALKVTATFGCSIFFGTATYANLVEVPARLTTEIHKKSIYQLF
jgi:hypothetical protein